MGENSKEKYSPCLNYQNPSLALGKQKPLKNVKENVVKAIIEGRKEISNLGNGTLEFKEEALINLEKCRADDIYKHRTRFKDANIVIAQCVFTKNQRNCIRKILGPELIFIILNLNDECQFERIEKRHGKSVGQEYKNTLMNYAKLCESAAHSEPNTYNIDINENMTSKDVTSKIIELISTNS